VHSKEWDSSEQKIFYSLYHLTLKNAISTNMCNPGISKLQKFVKITLPGPTVVSHVAVVVGLCTDHPKDF